ncbi:MAG TPA: alpha/beta fold hydrolase [Longimicrobium sp.]|nr:alpha/beta fold hydrolase [Longimicrobium sp.]
MPNLALARRFALLALLLPAAAAAQQANPARADRPRDAANPPAMEELKIPSGGAMMNGFIYLAQGAGPHPVAVFLHGYPGNERNLDLAQAARRAGWHALYFDYRGSWGSGGTFGFRNALDDVKAAIDFLRTPENRARFRVDPSRVAVVGHSMGGWASLQHAARGEGVTCAAALDAWNLGAFGRTAREHPERDPGAYFRQTTDAASGPIRADAGDLLREAVENAEAWDFRALGPSLKERAVFLAASTPEADSMRVALTRGLAQAGAAHVRSTHYDDDHSFSAHRVALADELVRWLTTECAAVQRAR